MKLENLKVKQDVTFLDAITLGLGKEQGLFFPSNIAPIENIPALLKEDFVTRSSHILTHLIGNEIPAETMKSIVEAAFTFAAPLNQVNENTYCLELFHGPTLAFKDFGARFMAQCLGRYNALVKGSELQNDTENDARDGTDCSGQKLTILTATSGDTGAAVAHAFHGVDDVEVVILYPKGKISLLQEKLFCTLGDNIKTLAIEGDFDDCQSMVKQAFQDDEVMSQLNLNSANSINIARLLAQVCYYFEAIAQLPAEQQAEAVISVPSGNFGNLTAGLIAKALGLPIKRFIAATNENDTVPRYLASQQWSPNQTKATLSNAMDVSEPNNWPRIEAMFERGIIARESLTAVAIDEQLTQLAMKQLYQQGYLSEPHAAIAYKALKHALVDDEVGIFLGTAHPAKFKDSVENILGEMIPLPEALVECASEAILSHSLPNDYEQVKAFLLCRYRQK
ncbi:threonine synthase [Flocculibacter collagenilyticus]|uniref:threonine synthase n=1 Tax=Flocculibacter collagenilyticus TaxID=2744479 RepID=UPI0018F7CA7C|nr:threonine synthase [Flocculibacter collagenilyticus]